MSFKIRCATKRRIVFCPSFWVTCENSLQQLEQQKFGAKDPKSNCNNKNTDSTTCKHPIFKRCSLSIQFNSETLYCKNPPSQPHKLNRRTTSPFFITIRNNNNSLKGEETEPIKKREHTLQTLSRCLLIVYATKQKNQHSEEEADKRAGGRVSDWHLSSLSLLLSIIFFFYLFLFFALMITNCTNLHESQK